MAMTGKPVLASHNLCPYVQRAAIVMAEKRIPFVRREVDLGNKPRWFLDISPLGKTPVLSVDGTALFDSTVICEYLEEAYPHPLHPRQLLERARHRSWMAFGSGILDNIAGFYSAPDSERLEHKRSLLAQQFQRLEAALHDAPYFSGTAFSMVDAFFGPVFRYFDVFERIGDFSFFDRCPRVCEWRRHLAARLSIREAVAPDYSQRLYQFLCSKDTALAVYASERRRFSNRV